MATPSIIFLCTGNCCRSQMGEGLMRRLAGDRLEVYSAGSHPAGYVHPVVIAAMAEIGIDIGHQWSKGLEEFADRTFDHVVTVCDHARDACPTLIGRRETYHWPLDDPIAVHWDEQAAMAVARRVRDELAQKLSGLLRDVGIESAKLRDGPGERT